MSESTATTSNYLSIALEDDRQADSSDTAGESRNASDVENGPVTSGKDASTPAVDNDKKSAREKRIAEAVKRSRNEYQESHVYTERRASHLSSGVNWANAQWYCHEERGVSKPKVDRQKLGQSVHRVEGRFARLDDRVSGHLSGS